MLARRARQCTWLLWLALTLLGTACSDHEIAARLPELPKLPDILGGAEAEGPGAGEIKSFRAVAADEPRAVLVGREALAAGGSAADAAVAMALVLSVTFPSTASLGGGGVCLIHNSASATTETLDFTAPAPSAIPPEASRPTAVPAIIRGFFALHARYGRVGWAKLVRPAEELARLGTPVSRALATDLRLVADQLLGDPSARFIFARPDGTPLEEGDVLEQFDLAAVLTKLRLNGAGDFYAGQVATALVRGAEAAGGSISRTDLRDVQVRWRPPVSVEIGDWIVRTSPPPAGGAVTTAEIWSMLADADRYRNADAVERRHLFAEAEMRAFLDRGTTLFPDGTAARPVEELLSRTHTRRLMRNYNPNLHTPPESVTDHPIAHAENPAATSFVILDDAGLAVACVLTLHNLFGTGRVAESTGIVLAAAPDREGIGPQPLAPLMVFDRQTEALLLVAAATGGAAAPTALAWTAVNLFYEGLSLTEAIDAPRLHDGGIPDRVLFEPGASSEWIAALERRGHEVKAVGEIGRVNAVYCPEGVRKSERCDYRSDRRGNGMAIGLSK